MYIWGVDGRQRHRLVDSDLTKYCKTLRFPVDIRRLLSQHVLGRRSVLDDVKSLRKTRHQTIGEEPRNGVEPIRSTLGGSNGIGRGR
jgi:hypothetical protein